jgi:hypothetical protein
MKCREYLNLLLLPRPSLRLSDLLLKIIHQNQPSGLLELIIYQQASCLGEFGSSEAGP